MNDDEARLCWRLFNVSWIPLGAMAAVLAVAVGSARFSVGAGSFAVMAALGSALAFAAYREAARGTSADHRRLFLPGAAAQAVFATIIVAPLTYVGAAAGAGFPLQDHAFAAIDAALGFDSRAVILFVNEQPWLSTLLYFGYGMIKWPLLGVPVVLSMTGRFLHLQRYTVALVLAMTLTVVISIFIPAISNYHLLGLTAADVPNINLHMVIGEEQDIPAIRDGSLRHLELLELIGIVAFPSFHAASAVLFAWALYPVRVFGRTALVLNGLMLVSTPVIGGHYLVDVIGGVAVAVASIAAAIRLSRVLSGASAAGSPAPVGRQTASVSP